MAGAPQVGLTRGTLAILLRPQMTAWISNSEPEDDVVSWNFRCRHANATPTVDRYSAASFVYCILTARSFLGPADMTYICFQYCIHLIQCLCSIWWRFTARIPAYCNIWPNICRTYRKEAISTRQKIYFNYNLEHWHFHWLCTKLKWKHFLFFFIILCYQHNIEYLLYFSSKFVSYMLYYLLRRKMRSSNLYF